MDMVNTMFERIKDIILQYVDSDDVEITESSKLFSDLGLDSLRLAAIMADLEDEFGTTISEENAVDFSCLGDVVAFLEQRN